MTRKNSNLILALVFCMAGAVSCGVNKLDAPIPPQETKEWPSARPDTDMAKGMYVGIVGFNDELKQLTPQILTQRTEYVFTNFIYGLTMMPGTGLYYAVDSAIDRVQTTSFPADLASVTFVTFTDGLDNVSIELNSDYASRDEYRDAIGNMFDGTTYAGLPVSAYSIGVKGNDVSDDKAFMAGLRAMASSDDNVLLVTNVEDLAKEFKELAKSLYSQTVTRLTGITIPAGYDDGTKIRFTFDNVTDAAQSKMYIEGTYRRNGTVRSLQNVVYNGLKSDSGTTLTGSLNGTTFATFSFDNLLTTSDANVPVGNEKQWYSTTTVSAWQRNSEFDSDSDVDVKEEIKSAIVMLVLDSTTSLGSTGFATMKYAANGFIYELAGY